MSRQLVLFFSTKTSTILGQEENSGTKQRQGASADREEGIVVFFFVGSSFQSISIPFSFTGVETTRLEDLGCNSVYHAMFA
jgi:hypothetical protein